MGTKLGFIEQWGLREEHFTDAQIKQIEDRLDDMVYVAKLFKENMTVLGRCMPVVAMMVEVFVNTQKQISS